MSVIRSANGLSSEEEEYVLAKSELNTKPEGASSSNQQTSNMASANNMMGSANAEYPYPTTYPPMSTTHEEPRTMRSFTQDGVTAEDPKNAATLEDMMCYRI